MAVVIAENESTLKLKNLICLKSSTARSIDGNPNKLNMTARKKIKFSENEIIVEVGVLVHDDKNSFEAEVVMCGIFEMNKKNAGVDDEIERHIMERNTVAIIFPYLRSQMSLITTQPDMTPVIIPPLNINAWFDSEK